MKLTPRLLWLLALGALTALGSALDGAPLTMTGKVGDMRKYKASATLALADGKGKGNITFDVSQRVSAVSPDGKLTLVVTPSNLVLEIDTQETPTSPVTKQVVPTEPPTSTTEVHSADGTLLSLMGPSVKAETSRITFLNSIQFPKTPLEKDKTWSLAIAADPNSGVVKSQIDFKVVGDEKVDGFDCWKLSRTARETDGDNPASLEGTDWVAKTDGSLVKRIDNWKNMPVFGLEPFKEASTTMEVVPSS